MPEGHGGRVGGNAPSKRSKKYLTPLGSKGRILRKLRFRKGVTLALISNKVACFLCSKKRPKLFFKVWQKERGVTYRPLTKIFKNILYVIHKSI